MSIVKAMRGEWLVLWSYCFLVGGLLLETLLSRNAQTSPLLDSLHRQRAAWFKLGFLVSLFSSAFVAFVPTLNFPDGRSVWMIVPRLALLAIIFFDRRRSHRATFLGFASGALLMLTQSLLSRSAMLDVWVVQTLFDWVHLLLAAAWLGGVAYLWMVVTSSDIELNDANLSRVSFAVDRFSVVAMFCVLGLFVGGIAQATQFIRDFADLWTTAYGQALSIKMVLFVALIGFGAYHRQVIVPKLRDHALVKLRYAEWTKRDTKRFRASLFLENLVSIALLLVVALMKALAI